MLKLPFVKNQGNQCMQSNMAMVLDYFFSERKFTLEQINRKMKRRRGKWTFPSQASVVLKDFGLSVKSYANYDVPAGQNKSTERKRLIEGFEKAFGKDYKSLMKNIDINVVEHFRKRAKEEKLFEIRKHSLKDFEEYLNKGYIVIPCVDANILWKRKRPFAGHFVTIVKMDKNNVWIHDPTKGPNIKYPKKVFNKAFKVKAIDDDVLVVFGRAKDDFTIRKATIIDLKDIQRLNFELFKKEYKQYDKSLNMKWTYGKVGEKYFRKKITRKDSFAEVAEKEGRVIGYMCGGIQERMFYRKKAKYAEAENMFIEKKFRRKGLGAILVKDFMKWCKKNKVDYVSTSASAQNKLGLKFYRRYGFKDYSLTLETKLDK